MTTHRPLRLAAWLIEWLAPGNEALHGDLAEEMARGRSRAWYWRQVLGAAGSAAARPVRADGIAGLEPAVLGLTMVVLLGFYVVFIVNVTDWLLRFEGVDLMARLPRMLTDWDGAAPMLTFALGALIGQLIGRGHARHRVTSIILFGATTMACGVAGLQAVAIVREPSILLPSMLHQVGTTAAFVMGLMGGVGSSLMAASRRLPLALAVAMALLVSPVSAVQSDDRLATPTDPVTAVIEAFGSHELVALCDAHGNAQNQAFLKALVRDPRFAATANDIVIEFGNARYQALVDAFVAGEAVAGPALRAVWKNTTIANEIPVDESFFDTVRGVNASLPRDRRLRVLLGDPPIDWTTVTTRDDHSRWLAMRDSFPAALVQIEVLAKRRRALIVYGQLHFQRKNIMSNFDMDDWRAQTLVSLIERSSPARVFTVWQFGDELAKIQPDVTGWPVPSMALLRGTRLGAADVSALMPSRGRMAVRNGALVPVAETEWRSLRVDEQIDAALYLGPRSAMTQSSPSAEACVEPGYLEERLRRIALTGIPAAEADRAKAVCSSVIRY